MKREVNILKLYGGIMFMGLATFLPYIFLYMRELGFSNAQIGILGAIGPAVMMLIQPFWGWLSDYTNRPERISLILTLGIAGAVTLLLSVKAFPLVVFFMVLYNLFYSSLVPTYDSIVFSTVAGTSVSYGEVRAWGSIGFAVIVFIVGKIIEVTSILTVLWMYIPLTLILAFLTTKLPNNVAVNTRVVKEKVSILPLLKNREVVIFLIAAGLVIGSNAINYTFFPFLMKELGGGEGLLGLAMMISAVAEIPFFLISARLQKHFKIPHMLLVAFMVTTLRWFLNSVAVSPYQLLVFQLLHSLTFGLLYSSAVIYVDQLVPTHLRASGQNLFWATTYGFGNVVGNLVGGWVFEYYSAQTLYTIAMVASALGVLVLLFGTIIPMRREMNSTITKK